MSISTFLKEKNCQGRESEILNFYHILTYILVYLGLFATSFYLLSLFSYYRKPRKTTDKKFSVSIIVPAFNEEKTISKTLQSLLELDYPKDRMEIIVVDDGSTDSTYSQAKRFESNIVRVIRKDNGGKGSALNAGIKVAKGELIASMDADSFVQKDALKKMVALFYNDSVMSVAPSVGIIEPKGILRRIQHIEYAMGVFLRKSFSTLNAIHVTPGAFSLYRKIFFDKYGGYDEHNITEDLEIALRIQSKGYVIENAEDAVAYTRGPRYFRELMIQRRRWYTGLARNLWRYKSLFGPSRGPLGTLVLPAAVIAIVLPMILVIYQVIKNLDDIRRNIILLQSIDFRFKDLWEYNSYIFEQIILSSLSYPLFLMSLLFLALLAGYLIFAKRITGFKERWQLNFVLFFLLYYFLFVFWWIVSTAYLIFNKKVIWRKEKHEAG
ncbi:MAG: glycosyltransferase family 2 protein [Candidatus Liptonbacteria bacterium]|nr:glycosyltransferase family 2 protein [Candidatus Pacearchaeota archaeon]MBM3257011.1 glycosyltransferase family 2 protein [Candidatus Liptonbacteria bacterium]